MSTENVDSVNPQANSVQPETANQDKVAYDTYKRVLNEAKKLKEQVKQFEDDRVRSHESKLKEQNEWKVLAETYQQQLEQTKSVLNEQEQSIVNGMKYQEFEKHLGGKLKNKDYATFIEFDKIVMNPETKRIDDESVKGVVSAFVKQHAHLVEFAGGQRMPNEAARNNSSMQVGKSIEQMTPSEVSEYILNLHKNGQLK
jgi:hypothetical protein